MKHQRGSALIISLLILMVLTILGVSAVSTATMEERMAANNRNQKIAFVAAETGATEAESAILNNSGYQALQDYLSEDKPGFYKMGELSSSDLFDQDAWQPGVNCISVNPLDNNIHSTSCYKAEILDGHNGLTAGGYGENETISRFVRITSRGTDSTGLATALVQTHLEYELTQ